MQVSLYNLPTPNFKKASPNSLSKCALLINPSLSTNEEVFWKHENLTEKEGKKLMMNHYQRHGLQDTLPHILYYNYPVYDLFHNKEHLKNSIYLIDSIEKENLSEKL